MVNGDEDMNFDVLTPVMSGRDQGRANLGKEEKILARAIKEKRGE